MLEFDKIFVTWRKGISSRRHVIGVLQKTPEGKNVFNYESNVRHLQETEGFLPYTEFQDINKEYNGNVAEIFGQRLTNIDRPDVGAFFKFWEVDESQANDKFYLLGKTQGLVPTDNFEFLADYKLSTNTHFLTELASLSQLKLPKGTLKVGDVLSFEKEPNNINDEYAVKAFKNETFVGYIKKIHSKVFYQDGAEKLKVVVKAIDQNGIIKRVFIKVSF